MTVQFIIRISIFVLTLLFALGQDQHPFKIQVQTQLVVEIVTVKDKKGDTIEGLTENDFIVTEDNVPQTISMFQFERLEDTLATPLQSVAPVLRTQSESMNQIPPVSAQYQNRRLLVLFFDMMNLFGTEQFRTLTAAGEFIQSRMKTPDLIAIMVFRRGVVSILQDFTDDRETLLNRIDALMYSENGGISDASVAFGQESDEFNLFNTDRQLSALQTAVNMLRPVNGQKSLVYFAGGLRLNGLDNLAQLRATINAAIRANVSIFAVDSRGLVAMAPLGDASRQSPGGTDMFSGATTMSHVSSFQRSQDTLYALAADTGGKAMLDTNDLTAGIVQAQEAITSYYVIGYYPTNTAPDGKFRRVRVSLREVPNAELNYRQGYYASKAFDKFTTADKERQLEEALMLDDPVTDLTIAMEINYFQLNRAEYFVPITVKIPGSELVLAGRSGALRTAIDFIAVVKDKYGSTIRNLRDKVEIKLKGETAAELTRRPVQYSTGFTLLPGEYMIKFLARNAESGRIGTYQTFFAVPNLMKEEIQIPISSVVLSSQQVDMENALATAGKNSRASSAISTHPLVFSGVALIPSVTRVFNKERGLYVYLEAYRHYATTPQALFAYVSFYRHNTKAFETAPVPLSHDRNHGSGKLVLKLNLSLSRFSEGQYVCQVTVIDPACKKAAFWHAPVNVIL